MSKAVNSDEYRATVEHRYDTMAVEYEAIGTFWMIWIVTGNGSYVFTEMAKVHAFYAWNISFRATP